MDRLLSIVPKSVIAFAAIVGGILFIVLSEPPHTICDSQLEIIKEQQKKFLYLDPKSKHIKTTKYENLRDHCKATNNPGGCYELFQEMKTLLHDLSTLSNQCAPEIGGIKEIRKPVWEIAELLVRLAWGEKPTEAYHAKFGWLDTADISFFCQMKARIYILYGEPAWAKFREKMMKELPGAKDLPRNQVWDMSLFSENCARYP